MRYDEGETVVFKYLDKKMIGVVKAVKYSRKDHCYYHTVRAENLSQYERLRVEPSSSTDRSMCILEYETKVFSKAKSKTSV